MAVCFFYSWDVVGDIGCARASRMLWYFCVKTVNALLTGSRMKEPFCLHETSSFARSSQPSTSCASSHER